MSIVNAGDVFRWRRLSLGGVALAGMVTLIVLSVGTADTPPPPPFPSVLAPTLTTTTEELSDAAGPVVAIARTPSPTVLDAEHGAGTFHSEAFRMDRAWRETTLPNVATGFRLQQALARLRETHDGARSEGYFSMMRRLMQDAKLGLCRPVPQGHQALPSTLNTELALCYSPYADVAVETKLRVKTKGATGRNGRVVSHTDRLGCVGLYVLRPVDPKKRLNVCNMSNKAEVSPSRHWAEGLRELAGPLHLRLFLEGPEIVVGHVQFDSRTCTYYAHFRVNSPGTYHVNFKAQHADYWGVDETLHRTKHNYNKYVISRGAPPLECYWSQALVPSSALPDLPSMLSSKAVARHAGSSGVWHHASEELARWVRRPTPHTLFDGRVPLGSTLQFAPYTARLLGVAPALSPPFGLVPAKGKIVISDADLRGAPRNEAIDPPQLRWQSATAMQQCFNRILSKAAAHRARRASEGPLKLFVSGDSQSRSVYWALKNYLATVERYGDAAGQALAEVVAAGGINHAQQEADEAIRRNITASKNEQFEAAASAGFSYEQRDKNGEKIKFAATNFFRAADGGGGGGAGSLVRVYYEWDSYLDHLAANAAKADVVIAGFGSHPASWGQWSYQKFQDRSRDVAKILCREAIAKRKPVLYYGCPAWPKMKLVENFRATNMRLGIFNGLAVAAIEKECRAQLAAAAQTVEEALPQDMNVAHPKFPVQLVDFFDLSTGMMRQSKDGSHYDGSVVVSTLAHTMLNTVCRSSALADDEGTG